MKKIFIIAFILLYSGETFAQKTFSLDDSLRGSITPQRAWWDLTYYHLTLKVDTKNRSIAGSNQVVYKVLSKSQELQIDLQPPLVFLYAEQDGKRLFYERKGANAYFIKLEKVQQIGSMESVTVYYSGKPQTAKRAPWDGGFSWSTDEKGNPFIATSCQGLGASVWWPCKDHMYDEPDSMRMSITVPDGLMDISNGRLEKTCLLADGTRTSDWFVQNPINNYGVNLNIGNYVSYDEVYEGEKGPLSVSYYVLPEDLEKAKTQFKDVPRMLKAFEHWFGPYPFYEDGYKLVQVPYLGMEHQSSITYGNKFNNGYLGRDLSKTGWGLKWDFIIIHESGHEWFANNITYKDIADMWIHESFTNYSETLFTEYYYGKEAGQDYVIGTRANITNDTPIIGIYDVNQRGSGDMYYKGGNMIHTIRHIIGDDEKFRSILRGLNSSFYHQTVTTKQIEDYISKEAGIDLSSVFDQYLRGTKIPKLEIMKSGKGHKYKWSNVSADFKMPIKIKGDGKIMQIKPTLDWQNLACKTIELDRNFYIQSTLQTFK